MGNHCGVMFECQSVATSRPFNVTCQNFPPAGSFKAIADAVAAQAYLVAVNRLRHLSQSVDRVSEGREARFLSEGPGRDARTSRRREVSKDAVDKCARPPEI